MRCPECGINASFKEDDVIPNLYYCSYCGMWFVIVELAWRLPENPEVLAMRKRFEEQDKMEAET